ncbi:hypothetical protein RHMOL_Rhmol05G0124600 [Rhododendron molle]|uniref:Uncharacterized protein n=1 Tax=Rhododendron molle TaxID=49168 RepID=A0ACC0NN31_RHOML|nr:hypothetical protein RHMOL_Rhmol05G0124600 [Rhododendron molle]
MTSTPLSETLNSQSPSKHFKRHSYSSSTQRSSPFFSLTSPLLRERRRQNLILPSPFLPSLRSTQEEAAFCPSSSLSLFHCGRCDIVIWYEEKIDRFLLLGRGTEVTTLTSQYPDDRHSFIRILALGTTDVQSFDFIDAPNAIAIDIAIRNLIQLGAVLLKNDVLKLTTDVLKLVVLGIEPWLGKLILECFQHCLGKEGLLLTAVMANASAIFCRLVFGDILSIFNQISVMQLMQISNYDQITIL